MGQHCGGRGGHSRRSVWDMTVAWGRVAMSSWAGHQTAGPPVHVSEWTRPVESARVDNVYRIAGKCGKDFNLAVWRIVKLNFHQ